LDLAAQALTPLLSPLQVKTPVVESDGGFSFWIPLPSAKGPVRAFLDRIRGVLTMPLPPYFAPHLHRIIGEHASSVAWQSLGI